MAAETVFGALSWGDAGNSFPSTVSICGKKKKDPSEMLLLSQKNQFNASAHRPLHCLTPEKTRLFHLGAAVHSLKIRGSVTKKR